MRSRNGGFIACRIGFPALTSRQRAAQAFSSAECEEGEKAEVTSHKRDRPSGRGLREPGTHGFRLPRSAPQIVAVSVSGGDDSPNYRASPERFGPTGLGRF